MALEAEERGSWDLPEGTTADSSCGAFLSDAERGRRLSASAMKGYTTLLRRLQEFCIGEGIVSVADLDVNTLRRFRESWREMRPERAPKPLSVGSLRKFTTQLRTFLTFCVDSGWLARNPARALKLPKAVDTQKIPFTEEEVKNIFANATGDLLTFAMLLRYSGLRIGDVLRVTSDHIVDEKLILRTAKGGAVVRIPLPRPLLDRLGQTSLPLGRTEGLWRERLMVVYRRAGVVGTPHTMRHTLAKALFLKGAPVEEVAAILGNSPQVVAKHYSGWIQERQNKLEERVKLTW